MSEIAVGDKVMLVYANCPHGVAWIGEVTVVESIRQDAARCRFCGVRTQIGAHALISLGVERGPVPVAWLKKIEPDAEAKAIEREAMTS